jgi:uncharacterized protein (TIGR02453 family)
MISQDTLNFLKEVTQNNNREWFQDNKERYDIARENVIEFAAAMIKELAKTDPGVADTDPKKAVKRIYRDIRFSKDKTPYKNHFGIGFSSSLTSSKDTTGYYVHIMPGGSFAGGGYWQPKAEHIKAIRQEIDYNAAELKAIVDDGEYVKLFGDIRNENSLKTLPRGYELTHPDIALLKIKDFIGMHTFTDAGLQKAGSPQMVADVLAKIYPLNEFLNNAIA